ncbi:MULTISPECIES: DUF3717 domain-containing protein [unclassified Janthinobacterium]|uniref:DUF3717 domain-containing protein n=1 Tax=unclassified Janthinobacterium TaxID=2610881 RepID=UPI0018C9CD4F|nr:DUF3717 domain-containing protein [Janthinobacterium sp. CG_23.4]MDH6156422.1 hypothetical protein [Janthinobacterium sp. CG_23.4]
MLLQMQMQMQMQALEAAINDWRRRQASRGNAYAPSPPVSCLVSCLAGGDALTI